MDEENIPVESDNSNRRLLIIAMSGVALIGICALLVLGFLWFRSNQASSFANILPLPTATARPTNVVPAPDQVSPADLTATQQAWIKPEMPPSLASAEDARRAMDLGGEYLEMYALNSPILPDINQPGDVYIYEIELPISVPLIWSYGWCTTTPKILDENFEHIQIEFVLNEAPVLAENISVIDSERSDGSPCREYAALIDTWTPGQHQFEIRVAFTKDINDGWNLYPAGTHTFKYNVNVTLQPAATTEAIQTVTARAAKDWNLILSDTFDNNNNHWYEGVTDDTDAAIAYSITAGKYRWETTARDYTVQQILVDIPVNDFYFSTDIENIGGDGAAGDYGIVFREDSAGNFYYFLAAINDSSCALFQFQNGEWTDLMEWQYCAPLAPYETNNFAVFAQGDQMMLLINDVVIGNIRDDSIKGDRIGLAVRLYSNFEAGTFEFDNLELRVP